MRKCCFVSFVHTGNVQPLTMGELWAVATALRVAGLWRTFGTWRRIW